MRIQKFLSRAGVASRRKAEAMVLDGRVQVNGSVVTGLGTKVQPSRDRVDVDGTQVRLPDTSWIRFHKPSGVLCTAVDTHERGTIYDLLPAEHQGLRYVGRLDLDTEGLLLLTNDGDVANRLQHPRYQVEREYEVTVQGCRPRRTSRAFGQASCWTMALLARHGWRSAPRSGNAGISPS